MQYESQARHLSQVKRNETFVGYAVTSFLVQFLERIIMQSVEFIIYFQVIFSTQKAKSLVQLLYVL